MQHLIGTPGLAFAGLLLIAPSCTGVTVSWGSVHEDGDGDAMGDSGQGGDESEPGDAVLSGDAVCSGCVPPVAEPPEAPSNLAASADTGQSISLAWLDNADNESSFVVEYRLASETEFRVQQSAAANSTTAKVTGLLPSTTYVFRVKATNSFGDSAYTNLAQASTPEVGSANHVRVRPAHVGIDNESARVIPGYVLRRVHVAADGDDAHSLDEATNSSTPWRTIERVNQAMGSLGPGDAILFRRGDTFRGNLRIAASGSQANPLFFGNYGTADPLPVLAASEVITGWTSAGGALQRATVAQPVTRLFVNGQEMPLARSPNSGLLYNSVEAPGRDRVTAPGLGNRTWSGGTVWVRTSAWRREARGVASQTGDIVVLQSATEGAIREGAGFIIENARQALDAPREWFYDAQSQTLYFWPEDGVDMSTARVEATVRPHVISLAESGDIADVEIRGLELVHSGAAAMYQVQNHIARVHVTDCRFRKNDVHYHNRKRLSPGNSTDCSIRRSELLESRGIGAQWYGAEDFVFSRNMVVDQMMDPQRGYGDGSGFSWGSRGGALEENYFLRSGYHSVVFGGSHDSVIQRNVIIDSAQVLSDSGGIYGYGAWTERVTVRNNVIVGARGSGVGAHDNYDGAYAIYIDNDVVDATVEDNLVFDCHYGVFFNSGGSGFNCNRNIVVGTAQGMQFNTGGDGAQQNLIVGKADEAWMIKIDVLTSVRPDILGVFDRNTYRHPFAHHNMLNHRGSSVSWESWQMAGQDPNGVFMGSSWPAGADADDKIRVFANTALAARVLDPGDGEFVDLSTGASVMGPFTLDPFSFRVLERD